MPQSEDKLALELLQCEIEILNVGLKFMENKTIEFKAKVEQLESHKKSMENYLNSDNN